MLLSILIVNYNGLRHLPECLGSIRDQGFEDYEVVFVDNASADDSVAYVEREFPFVRVIRSDVNRGFAGGNNFGAAHCRGDFVFFLNNDTRLAPDALARLAGIVNARPGVNIFACFLLDYHKPDAVDSAGDYLYTAGSAFSYSGFPAERFSTEREIPAACAGAAVYKRATFTGLGGFDEDFFLVYEDMDLSLRARHAGERILFLPQVKVFHKGSASMGGKRGAVSFYHAERNFPWLVIKNAPLPSLLRMLAGQFVVKTFRFLLAVRYGLLPSWLRANVDTLGKIPVMLRKRRRILRESRLTDGEFAALLRPGWFRERLAVRRGRYADVP